MVFPQRYVRTVRVSPEDAVDAVRACAAEHCRFESLSVRRFQLSPPAPEGAHNEPRAAVLVRVSGTENGHSSVEVRFVPTRLLPSQRWSWASVWVVLFAVNLVDVGFSWALIVHQLIVSAIFGLVYAYTLRSARQSRDADMRLLVDVLEGALGPLVLSESSEPTYRMLPPLSVPDSAVS